MGKATASRIALAITIVAATLASCLPASLAQGVGSELVEEVAAHEVGENAQVRLEDADGFAAGGGEAVFEPGTTNEEAFTYDSVDYETNRLIGLTRINASDHPVGSFVESVDPAPSPPEESPSPSPTPTPSETTTTPSDSGSSPPTDEGDSAAPSSDEAAPSAGVIPGPCDVVSALCAVIPPIDVGCQGCDTLVEEILDLVGPCLQKSGCAEPVMAIVRTVVYEACGTDDPLYCEDKYSRLIYELVDQLCPYGLTTCADPYVNFVADLIMGIVCPSGSLGYCAGELNGQVNDQLAVVVGIAKSYVVYACGGETTTDCANRVLDILYKTVLPIVCQAGDAFTCVDNTADTINDVVANACSFEKGALNSSEASATSECVSRVLATVQLAIKTANDAMIIACQSTDANACLRNLLETVDETLSTACSFIPGLSTSPGLDRCVERTLDLVDLAVEIAQQQIQETCGSTDPRRCVEMATGEAFKAVDAVNDLLANTCKQSIGATTSTSDDAVVNCVARVQSTVAQVQQLAIKTANDAMITVCQSTDANTCLRNLLETVDETLSTACSFIPGLSTSPGLDRCVERTLDLVDLAVEIAQQQIQETCGSTDPRRCVEMATGEAFKAVDAVNDVIANLCRTPTGAALGSTNESAVTNCTTLVIQTVNAGLEAARQRMRDTCGSDNPTVCADNVVAQLLVLVDRVNDFVSNTCNQEIGAEASTTESGATTCVERALATVAAVQQLVAQEMVEACGSSDPNACAANVIVRVNVEINRICASVPGTDYSSGANRCVARALEIVDDLVARARRILDEICPVDAAGCAGNLVGEVARVFEMIGDTIDSTCRQQVSTRDAEITSSCVDVAAGVVDVVVTAVCGDGNDASTCGALTSPDELIDRILDALCVETDAGECGGTLPVDPCGLIGLRVCQVPPQIPVGEPCDQEEASGFCADDLAGLEVNPCMPLSVCQDAPPVTPEFQESCNAAPQTCTTYVVPSNDPPPEPAPGEEGPADGESATPLGKPVGKTTSIYRWYYEKGSPQAYGICKKNPDGTWGECKEVGKMKFGAVIELRGRRSFWKQWSWAIEGVAVKQTHLWNCTDDNTGSPFGDTSCSDGWEERTADEYSMAKWWRPDGGYSVYHDQDELYFYSFFYKWKASGYPGHEWRFPEASGAHHRYSLKFECLKEWGPDENGECRFPHEA